jgi:hypothetical protein
LGSAFFGLTSNYKFQVYDEIHDLVYYGNGGFLYSEVYNMPIHLRRYHIRKINKLHEERNKAEQDAMSKSQQSMNSIPKMPNIPKNIRR